jgi:nucleoside-diphosphate-sugar epimerase
MTTLSKEAVPRGVLIVGCGYSGRMIARAFVREGVPVWGTTRTSEGLAAIQETGATALIFQAGRDSLDSEVLAAVDTVVDSVGPPWDGSRDSTEDIAAAVADAELLRFIYLSSTGVYGDKQGEWVDEFTECTPSSPQGIARLAVEDFLRGEARAGRLPALIARLPGIYGPGRSLLHRLASGRFRFVGPEGPFSNRIHVEDLASGVVAMAHRGHVGEVYLLVDESACRLREAAAHAADLLGIPLPDPMDMERAQREIPPRSLAMLTESKRLRTKRLREELGVTLKHPTFREGLAAIHAKDWNASD